MEVGEILEYASPRLFDWKQLEKLKRNLFARTVVESA